MSVLELPVSYSFSQVLETIADVAAALRDPHSKLDDLAAASKEARELIERANAASRALDERIAEHDERMKTERAEHDDALLVGRQALATERATFEKTRGALLDEASKARDQARNDSEAAAQKLKELNAKLAAISQAAAA
jgi:hypothetical protein